MSASAPVTNATVDVLVIGAGPAGSVSAAVVHRAGLSVRVIEREQFPRFVIGESLLPRCMEVLDDLDFLDAIRAKKFQEKFGAKFIRGDEVSDFNFSNQYTKGWTWTWQVPRAEFDQVLIQEVERRGVPVAFQTTVERVEFLPDETSVVHVRNAEGVAETIRARFIIDSSGYGRVIPRQLGLDRPSTQDPRKAVFAHMLDPKRAEFDEPNRIVVVMFAPGVWTWVIPFSSGTTSVGFVGDIPYFARQGATTGEQFRALLAGHPYLRARFEGQPPIFEPRSLESWSATTDKFYGPGYVLTGNVTEFLDPIFSSGVMFATVSAHLASSLVVSKLRGERPMDDSEWDREYTQVIRQGVDTFRTYVSKWYDGTLETLFFAKDPPADVTRKICSVLAGYVWDQSNPFVANHEAEVTRTARIIRAMAAGKIAAPVSQQ